MPMTENLLHLKDKINIVGSALVKRVLVGMETSIAVTTMGRRERERGVWGGGRGVSEGDKETAIWNSRTL